MSLNFKNYLSLGLQRLVTLDRFTLNKTSRSLVPQGCFAKTLDSGTKIYHYVRENDHEKSRIHLRIDPDGTGTLIVNANRVMHLNPTAALMAYLILEGKREQEIIQSLRHQYR